MKAIKQTGSRRYPFVIVSDAQGRLLTRSRGRPTSCLIGLDVVRYDREGQRTLIYSRKGTK